MADIAGKVAWIRQAIEGKDVRESLASGIEVINEETENTTSRQGKVEHDFESIKASEADRVQSESTRKENEENRVSNENARVSAENIRITNEIAREKIINNFKSFGEYSPDTTYNQFNTVTHNYSTFMCLLDGTKGIEPVTTGSTNWLILALKGQDGTGGDMYKQYYDPNGDGVIDIADNSNKLGGNSPDYYEKKGEIDSIPVDVNNPDVNYTLKYDKKLGRLRLVPFDYVIDNTPPGTVSNFVALAGDTKVTLNWTNPTDSDFAGVKIIRKVGSYPTSMEDGTQIYDGIDTSHVDEGLTNDTEYFYRAFPYDESQNYNDTIDGQQVSSIPAENTDTEPPSVVSNFTVTAGNGKVDLSWVNPTDEDFAGVKILRKTIGYPSSTTDGDLVYNGAGISFEDTTIENGTTYYYRIFPYDTAGNYNIAEEGQEVTATPKAYVIYGVKIDTANSNPETALIYTDNAVGFTPAQGNNGSFSYGSWQDKFPFNQIRPCLYLNGAVNYYLDPNDYTKKEDGITASDITTGNDGDVMVEFPKIYWIFETVGTDLYVKYSDTKVDDNYKCLAHMRGTTEKDKCYISAYLGYTLSSKLRSLSGKIPNVNQPISAFRTLAQANGSGYDQMAYYQLLMLQVLFITMFKNRDSQTALGRGYVDGNSASISTGRTNQKGLFYGETTGKLQNKFCGIEDFWGNCYYWIDGLYSDSNWNILIGNQNFNDTGSGYTNHGQGATSNISGYISGVQGTTETGFLIKTTAGSATTHYSDYGALSASYFPYFGGSWAGADAAGAFYLSVNFGASNAYADVGGRLLAL
ncbi:fibronectin type III domain-containing protein [Clostridium tyrobutyricum]|uniref:fibronectin type III domain-containing protein n=1 Tax=Clostridium tyrobutyricum TaxID=1519 RepID=UPI0024200D1A|nr:hypothetical protein [Clostridium tyrobutyricum]